MSRIGLVGIVTVVAGALALRSTPSARAQSPMPRVLAVDSFNDATRGVLPASSTDPRLRLAYADGEYVVQILDAAFNAVGAAYLRDSYDDVSIAVDARMIGTPERRAVAVHCRRGSGDSSTGYRLVVLPGPGRFSLLRFDNGVATDLVAERASDLIERGDGWNRIALSCAGTQIEASINGSLVGSVQDTTYRRGDAWIGAYNDTTATTLEAHFDNLLVATPAVLGRPVLAADTFDDPAKAQLATSAGAQATYRVGYANGEYQMQTSSAGSFPFVHPIGDYVEAALAVDARIVGDVANRFVAVGCLDSGDAEIRLTVYPQDGTFTLAYFAGSTSLYYDDRTRIQSAAIKRGNATNRLSLICIDFGPLGAVVTAQANGETLAVFDVGRSLEPGRVWIGAGTPRDSGVTIDARFDNLVVWSP